MTPLAKIQAAIKAPKGQFNTFGKYKYRSCEDIVEAVKPVINPLGFHLTISDEVILIGNRFYVKSTAILSNGTDSYSSSAFAREEEIKKGMDSSQITGAASSYARKYALNGLFAIDDTKDADSVETKDTTINEVFKDEAELIISWDIELGKCKTKSDLLALYNGNKATIDNDQAIKDLFKKRYNQIKK